MALPATQKKKGKFKECKEIQPPRKTNEINVLRYVIRFSFPYNIPLRIQKINMPVDYTKYPENWFSEIRPKILIRAKWCCENCGVGSGKIGYRDEQKVFIECDNFMKRWAESVGKRVFKIVLTIAHLNHNVTDNRDENLKALCQKCHLNYDREHHLINRKINAARKRNEKKKR